MNTVPITQVRNAVSLNSDNTRFEVEINHPTYGWIPYHLRGDDTCQEINNSDLLALIGNDFTVYVAPTQEELDEQAAGSIRSERNAQLEDFVDPIVSNPLRWSSLTKEEQESLTEYRTALLNITNQEGFPHNVTWPTKTE
jgi:hypothetical protein